MAKAQEVVYFESSTGLNTESSRIQTKPTDLLEALNVELGKNFFVRPRRGIDFIDPAIITTTVTNYSPAALSPAPANGIFFKTVAVDGTIVEYGIVAVANVILVFGAPTPTSGKIAFDDFIHFKSAPKQAIIYATTVGRAYYTELVINGNNVFVSNSYGHLGTLALDPADTTNYNLLFTPIQVNCRYINTVTEDPANLTNAGGTATALSIRSYAWQATPLPQDPGITAGNAVPTTRIPANWPSAPVYVEFSSSENLAVTPGIPRPSKIAFYAGRCFMTGFSLRPNALYFSSVIQNESNYGQMYQAADPFSLTDPNPIASDGAVVVIEGADVNKNLAATYNNLVLFAGNSIWILSGGSGGFSALDFNISRLSQEGILGAESMVKVENDIYFFGNTNIYKIVANEIITSNLDVQTKAIGDSIISLYQGLPASVKETAKGVYDRGSQKITWYMTDKTESAGMNANIYQQPVNFSYKLVYNIRTGGFTEHTISPSAGAGYKILGAFNAPTTGLRANKPAIFEENRDCHFLILGAEGASTTDVTIGISSGETYSDFGSVASSAVNFEAKATLFDSVFQSLMTNKQSVILYTAFLNVETSDVSNNGSCYALQHYNWSNADANFSYGGNKPPKAVYRPRNRGIGSIYNNLNFNKDLIINKTLFRGAGKSFNITFSNSFGFSSRFPTASATQKAEWDANVAKDFDLVGFAVGLRSFKKS